MAKSIEPLVESWAREQISKLGWKNAPEQIKIDKQLSESLNNHLSKQGGTGGGRPDHTLIMDISDLFKVSLDSLIRGDEKFQKKIKVKNTRVGMTFWDFLSYRWWIIFVIAWCLSWLLPVIIRAFK